MSSTMRIAVSNSMKIWGGGENWSLTAAAGLAERGHSVSLICDPEGELRARAERSRSGTLTVIPLRLRGDFNPAAVVGMTGFLRRERIQAVVCNMDREVRTLGPAAWLCGRIPFVRRRGSDYPFKNRLRFRLTYRLLVDAVLVNSESTRNTILAGNPWMPPGKLFRIYNGIPTDRYFPSPELREAARLALGIPAESFVAGMAGAMLPRKRHDTLIRAAATVRDRIPSFRLLIVGPGRDPDYMESLRAMAGELGLGDSTLFLGAEESMNGIYNAMDVLVMASENEGFGYCAAEAMAAGTVAVVSDASSLPEVVGADGESGFVFSLGDHDELARILVRLSGSPGLRASVSLAGRQRVIERFGLVRMVSDLEDFLRGLTGLSRPPSSRISRRE